MLENLCWFTALVCALAIVGTYLKYRDPFHPAIVIFSMCSFVYVIMPLSLARSGGLYSFVSEHQAEWVQLVVIGGLISVAWGLFAGSHLDLKLSRTYRYRPDVLRKGAYVLGAIGLLAWFFVIASGGGFLEVFGRANGRGWSEVGYVRETVYLIIVGLLLLFSAEVYNPKNKLWWAAVMILSLPYLIQGLLGAQRGPTFLITVTLGMSWYMARGRRPSLAMVVGAGLVLGSFLLFLVTNRAAIYVGSEEELKTDVSGILDATEANEYIFGAGCMVAAHQTGNYFWGKRYLAQLAVRPIPRQLWPNKYVDFGVPELEQNAGVAKAGLEAVMGWKEVPGAAGAMIADLWVEFSWLMLPVLWLIGYAYGSTWQKAVRLSGPWNTQYTILALLSIYMVSQSGEAVIFRLVILSVPSWWVWRKARYA